jgi:hypothetical protein
MDTETAFAGFELQKQLDCTNEYQSATQLVRRESAK